MNEIVIWLLTFWTFWFVGQRIVNSCMMWWFLSPLPIELTHILRRLGWQKFNDHFWPEDAEYENWVHWQWETWMTSTVARRYGWLGGKVTALLTCPWCFSFHIAFWVATLMATGLFLLTGNPKGLFYILPCALSWPSEAAFKINPGTENGSET